MADNLRQSPSGPARTFWQALGIDMAVLNAVLSPVFKAYQYRIGVFLTTDAGFVNLEVYARDPKTDILQRILDKDDDVGVDVVREASRKVGDARKSGEALEVGGAREAEEALEDDEAHMRRRSWKHCRDERLREEAEASRREAAARAAVRRATKRSRDNGGDGGRVSRLVRLTCIP